MKPKKVRQPSVEFKPIGSKVIKSSYQYVDNTGIQEFDQREGEIPKAVITGHLKMEKQPSERISLSYNPTRYGIAHRETLEGKLRVQEETIVKLQQQQENLKQKIENKSKSSFDEGYKAGKREGVEEGKNEISSQLNLMNELIGSIHEDTVDYYRKLEDRLADFAMMIARKVVGDAANAHRDVAVELAKTAIRQAIDKSSLTIQVNPVDYETLRAARADLKSISEGIKLLKWNQTRELNQVEFYWKPLAVLLMHRLNPCWMKCINPFSRITFR